MLSESGLFTQVYRFQQIPDPRGKVGGHGGCESLCSVGISGSGVFGGRAFGAVVIAVATLGGPLVFAALANVLKLFQNLYITDVSPFAGNRAVAAAWIATAIAFVAAGFLPGKSHLRDTDWFTLDLIKMFFDVFGAHLQFAFGAAGRAARIGIALCSSRHSGG